MENHLGCDKPLPSWRSRSTSIGLGFAFLGKESEKTLPSSYDSCIGKMEVNTAYWLLSTIALSSLTLVGFILVAMIFFIDQMQDFISKFSHTEQSYKQMSKILSLPPRLYFSFVILFIFATLGIGVAVSLGAVLRISEVGTGINSMTQTEISSILVEFIIFVLMVLLSAIACLSSGLRFTLVRLEEMEKKEEGTKSSMYILRETLRNLIHNKSKKENQRNRSKPDEGKNKESP